MLSKSGRCHFGFWSIAILFAIPQACFAQAEEAAEKPQDKPGAAATLEGPPPITEVQLLPKLPTTPSRRGSTGFNVHMVDASLLPRDKQGIWVLDFSFKPMRIRTIEIPGKGRRQIHYLYYRVVNRTGKARDFVPQFTILTDTGKRFEESVIPNAVKIIKAREDDAIPLLGAVDIAGTIPPSTKPDVDDAVYGVAVWEGLDPKADRMSIYVRGLSDGFKEIKPQDGGKTTVKYKTLRIDLIRRGDDRNLNEKEIELNDPAYEWIYW